MENRPNVIQVEIFGQTYSVRAAGEAEYIRELADSREGAVHVAELNEKVSRLSTEREEVRARIERLVKSLEETPEGA